MTASASPRHSIDGAHPTWEDVRVGARFFTGAVRVLRQPVTSAEAHAVLRHRLERRQQCFLGLARDAIYGYPASPYRQLLGLAGCEYGDLERLVREEDVEGALRVLLRKGVYLTVDELKGRTPVVRGAASFDLAPGALRNPGMTPNLVNRSSGSRGTPMAAPISFSSVRDEATETFLDYEAREGLRWVHAYWTVPGGTALMFLVKNWLCGSPLDQLFLLVDPADASLHPRYAWSERALRVAARLAGGRMPRPVCVPLHQPLRIARWLSAVLRAGRTPCLHLYASAAVRICQAAEEAGIDLRGAQFEVGGEAATPARMAACRAVGVEAHVRYASTEAGPMGKSCMTPLVPDDIHFRHDRLAVIQPGEDAPMTLPSTALLVTTVLPQARLVLLNTSFGDQAVVTRRSCGCPLERLGWTTHLHSIRSFEKLTAGGMTFFDADVVRILDETLPARFGGGPTDYQLVDEETRDGRPGVRLVAHPRLGRLDASALRRAFLDEIGQGAGVERIMAAVWDDAGLPTVERTAPRETGRGKIQHIHRERLPSATAPDRPRAAP